MLESVFSVLNIMTDSVSFYSVALRHEPFERLVQYGVLLSQASMQNQCQQLQGSGSSREAGPPPALPPGHPEAARELQPCCSQALVDRQERRVSLLPS